MRELAAIQRRFHALVTAGEGVVEPGLLGGSRRLDVYAGMYTARLHDVLVADHPKLRAALGAERFRAVSDAFVRALPPTSFTVRDLGVDLASYLATRADLPPWAADLAALERARVEVFDAADATARTRDELAALPPEELAAASLGLVPAALVVPLAWTVDELWSELEDGAPPPPVTAATRTVLVWRRDLAVLHRTLDDDEAALVPHLAAGTTLAELGGALAPYVDGDPAPRLVELLTRWLDAAVVA